MLTLWDLLDPLLEKLVPAKGRAAEKAKVVVQPERTQATPAAAAAVRTKPVVVVSPVVPKPRKRAASRDERAGDASMQAKYDAVVEHMLEKYQIRVRKWRKNMSGVAWYVTYRDGRRVNLIESPKPKGPMSVAVFLHEIGHHAIGFDVYKPRCLEEYHAWKFSIEAMQSHGLNVTDAVKYRMHRSLHYAVAKAVRRGIKRIPIELEPYLAKAVKPRRGSASAS